MGAFMEKHSKQEMAAEMTTEVTEGVDKKWAVEAEMVAVADAGFQSAARDSLRPLEDEDMAWRSAEAEAAARLVAVAASARAEADFRSDARNRLQHVEVRARRTAEAEAAGRVAAAARTEANFCSTARDCVRNDDDRARRSAEAEDATRLAAVAATATAEVYFRSAARDSLRHDEDRARRSADAEAAARLVAVAAAARAEADFRSAARNRHQHVEDRARRTAETEAAGRVAAAARPEANFCSTARDCLRNDDDRARRSAEAEAAARLAAGAAAARAEADFRSAARNRLQHVEDRAQRTAEAEAAGRVVAVAAAVRAEANFRSAARDGLRNDEVRARRSAEADAAARMVVVAAAASAEANFRSVARERVRLVEDKAEVTAVIDKQPKLEPAWLLTSGMVSGDKVVAAMGAASEQELDRCKYPQTDRVHCMKQRESVWICGCVEQVDADVALVSLRELHLPRRICALLRGEFWIHGSSHVFTAPLNLILRNGQPVSVSFPKTCTCPVLDGVTEVSSCLRPPESGMLVASPMLNAVVEEVTEDKGFVSLNYTGHDIRTPFYKKCILINGAKVKAKVPVSTLLHCGLEVAVRISASPTQPGSLAISELKAWTNPIQKTRMLSQMALLEVMDEGQLGMRDAVLRQVTPEALILAMAPQLDQEVKVNLCEGHVWVNGRPLDPSLALGGGLRAGWPVRLFSSRSPTKTHCVLVDDKGVLGVLTRDQCLGIVVKVGPTSAVATFALAGSNERAIFERDALRMNTGQERILEDECPMSKILQVGQRVLLSLTLGRGQAGFAFKATAVEPQQHTSLLEPPLLHETESVDSEPVSLTRLSDDVYVSPSSKDSQTKGSDRSVSETTVLRRAEKRTHSANGDHSARERETHSCDGEQMPQVYVEASQGRLTNLKITSKDEETEHGTKNEKDLLLSEINVISEESSEKTLNTGLADNASGYTSTKVFNTNSKINNINNQQNYRISDGCENDDIFYFEKNDLGLWTQCVSTSMSNSVDNSLLSKLGLNALSSHVSTNIVPKAEQFVKETKELSSFDQQQGDKTVNGPSSSLPLSPASILNSEENVGSVRYPTTCQPVEKAALSTVESNLNSLATNTIKEVFPVNEKMAHLNENLEGPFTGRVVAIFPRSAVAKFSLSGVSTRVFFFQNSVVGSSVPDMGEKVILEQLKRIPESQLTKTYNTTLQATSVKISTSSSSSCKLLSGRTGAIKKYTDANSGFIEVTLSDQDTILGKFSKAQVRADAIPNGKSLQVAWPPGTIVHYHGVLTTQEGKDKCVITHVWPQGAKPMEKIKNEPNVPEILLKTMKQKILAHTGRVSRYYSSSHGLIDFRLGDMYLSTEFISRDCSGLVPNLDLSQQWPLQTVVHFDGELIQNGQSVKFCVSKVWSGKRPAFVPCDVPQLSAGPHVGKVTELRPPCAFVVTLPKPIVDVKVFVLSSNFRKSICGPLLHESLPVESLVYVGETVWVQVKRVTLDSGKDCHYRAIDGWPDPNNVIRSEPVIKPLAENVTLPVRNCPNTSTSGAVNTGLSSPKAMDHQISNATNVSESNAENQEGLVTKMQSSDGKGLGRMLSSVPSSMASKVCRRCCVVLAHPSAVLLRIKGLGCEESEEREGRLVAVHAKCLFLCGVPLANVVLNTLLHTDQEMNVHLSKDDEDQLKAEDSSSSYSEQQNCVYLSSLWLDQPQFESPSLQFAALTKFCREHKVIDSIYQDLTHCLGRLLKYEILKRKDMLNKDESESEEDLTIEEQDAVHEVSRVANITNPSPSVEEVNETSGSFPPEQQLNNIDTRVREQLKAVGPEKFLQIQMTQFTQMVLEKCLEDAQECFLSSLQQNCSDPELYTRMASQAPSIILAATQEFFLLKQKEALSNGPKGAISILAPTLVDGSSCPACAQRAAAVTATAVPVAGNAANSGDGSVVRDVTSGKENYGTVTVTEGDASHIGSSSTKGEGEPEAVEEDGWTDVDGGEDGFGGDDDDDDGCYARAGGGRGRSRRRRRGLRETTNAQQGSASALLLRGIHDVLVGAQEELKATGVKLQVSHAMQEPERDKLLKNDSSSGLNVVEKRDETEPTIEVKSPSIDRTEDDKVDCQDIEKSLNAEIQKHARELAIFRDEAFRLIENWKSADSPPATPEELEFLQELSLLLDNKAEKTDRSEDDTYGLARQLIKFWKVANFPLSPLAKRGLQRLQEVLELPDIKGGGIVKMENPSCGGAEGIREVEVALKEVRDAFRDVKHVFEVQRCFRDLRECFKDVRRAYRNREPRPRALPPCADAPAISAALAESIVPTSMVAESLSVETTSLNAPAQGKKRGLGAVEISDNSGSSSPAGMPAHSQPKKKQAEEPESEQEQQFLAQCATCKAKVIGQGSAEIISASTQNTEVTKTSQSASTMTSSSGAASSVSTSDRAAQTISTGAVLALHLLPDE